MTQTESFKKHFSLRKIFSYLPIVLVGTVKRHPWENRRGKATLGEDFVPTLLQVPQAHSTRKRKYAVNRTVIVKLDLNAVFIYK